MPCTRAQIVTFLYRLAGSPEVSGSCKFADVTDKNYIDAITWAAEEGVTKGTTETTFSPNATCTRAQAVTFLHRYMDTPKADQAHGFTDVTNTGAFYYDAVMWAADNGVTLGLCRRKLPSRRSVHPWRDRDVYLPRSGVKMKKRSIALILLVLMICSLLAGCHEERRKPVNFAGDIDLGEGRRYNKRCFFAAA